jgi:dipeptidyl aminopeptidase/acylaminoacyl peptidase
MALQRLNKDALFVSYWGEGHRVAASPANLRDMGQRVFAWYDEHIGPPAPVCLD